MQATAPTAHCVPASARWRSPNVAAILPTVKVRAVADPDERVSAKELALGLPKHAWRTITWRDGSADPLRSRFARVRVRTAPIKGATARPEEMLLIEWPHGEAAPTKYWLSNVAKTISFRELVDIAKMRWRIERDYQDLKQEIGLGHYEGRGWRGFHHHGTLCIAAYGFLISERETIPPQDHVPPGCSRNLPFPVVTDPAAPPLRPQRHIPNSIATIHCAMVVAIARMLPRCPCCARRFPRNPRRNL
jgi:hypothetical protein